MPTAIVPTAVGLDGLKRPSHNVRDSVTKPRYYPPIMTAKLSDAELLARLVAFDSVSGNSNLPIADFICEYLDEPAIEVQRIASPDGSKTNVLAWVGPESPADARAGLMLSGHMDVVPANEPDWKTDPFALMETEDAYFGRGSCDMKGFVSLAINTLRRASEWKLLQPLALLLSYDEEVGLLGAARFVETWEPAASLPRSVLVGEPTSLRLARMHKGFAQIRISCSGVSAHSAYPHLGRSAIEPAGAIVSALAALREELAELRAESSRFYPDTPGIGLNIGTISGGSAANVVPDRCAMELSLRTLPGMDAEASLARVRQAVESVSNNGDATVEILCNNAPVLVDEDCDTYRRLQEITGQTKTTAVAYSTDAAVLQRLDLECILLGPGNIDVAHKPNEFLPKSEFIEGGMLLERIVRKMCGEKP